MSAHYSKLKTKWQRFFAVSMMLAMLLTSVPTAVFAEGTDGGDAATTTEETTQTPEETNTGDGGTGTETNTNTEETGGGNDGADGSGGEEGVGEGGGAETTDTGSTTPDEVVSDGDTGTSTDDGTATSSDPVGDGQTGEGTGGGEEGGDGTDTGADGIDGGDNASSTEPTATTTATSTEPTSGTEGEGGGDGDSGGGVESTDDTPEEEQEPVPVVSENEVGEDATPDDGEGYTGGVARTGRSTVIDTGDAVAQGELETYANNNHVKSIVTPETEGDLDIYTFRATGTNEAVVKNEAAIFAATGENTALSTGSSKIYTGDAVAGLNIANVINSNVINSDGFLYLKNHKIESEGSIDLGGFFFPDESETFALADDCDLLSCRAEDVIYEFSQQSFATVTNEALIEANSGDNVAEGDYALVETGNAYGGANVINVVNTNIVDSNYRLLTYNALGDLEGDLILPTQELFHAFYSRPNGMTQVESAEEIDIFAGNFNEADVQNNVETFAESGSNDSTTAFDSLIKTGRSESESNILNRVNHNVYGGDTMFLQIRVHGEWSGDIFGLPEGLDWMWTSDGIIIYNPDGEIAPSEILPYDVDSYKADFVNQNDVVIENNINIDAITGRNSIDGLLGDIRTGEAVASANVMNIANTNVIGANWTMAVINIFGDFDGNVTFSSTDIGLTGEVSADDDPLLPASPLTYTYFVTNHSDVTATGVVLRQTLENAFAGGTNNQQEAVIGTLNPGQTVEVTLLAEVDPNIPYGTSSVVAVASVDSDQSDDDASNNSSLLTLEAHNEEITDSGGDGTDTGTTTDEGGGDDTGTTTDDGTGADDDSGTTTDDGTASSTDEANTDDDEAEEVDTTPTPKPQPTGGGGGGSGGGGGNKTSAADVDREQSKVDPNTPPELNIYKRATNVKLGETIKAGDTVDYKVTVKNKGGQAYDATVYDVLRNPIGSVVDEQSWELGTILAGEEVTLTYSTLYNPNTPSGLYTNTASLEAYATSGAKKAGNDPLEVEDAQHTIEIEGLPLAIGNVAVLTYIPAGNGKYSAIVTWETSKPADGQVFFEPVGLTSPYNPTAKNYGYDHATIRLPMMSNKHFLLVTGLTQGVKYTYRLRSGNGQHVAFGGDYNLTVPGLAPRYAATPKPTVAGISTTASTPTPSAPTPAPSTVATTPKPNPEPEVAPEPEPQPEPEAPVETGGLGGFVSKVSKSIFGFFR